MDLLLLSTIVLASILVIWRSTFGFALLVSIQLVFREVGLISLAQSGLAEYSTAWLHVGAVVAFIAGYWLCLLAIRNKPTGVLALKPLPDPSVAAIVTFAGLLGSYHLIAVGIPIFSSGIEVARFDFTGSGFFGVPGRMYLFGVTLAWVIASANAQAHGTRWREYGPWRWATGFLLATSLLGGFKGEILSLTVMIVAVSVIVTGKKISGGDMIVRYWWAALVGLAYFSAIAALYPSYSSRGDGFLVQFFDRLTVIPAQAVQFAIEGFARIEAENALVGDFVYFVFRYAGAQIPGTYSLDRAVSAAMIGVDPRSTAWTTPVTIGGFAELYISLGFLGALLGLALAGAVLAFGESAPRKTTVGLIGRALLGLVLVNWLIKGGLAYNLLNYAAVVAILSIVGYVAYLIRRPGTPAHLVVPRTNARRRGYGPDA